MCQMSPTGVRTNELHTDGIEHWQSASKRENPAGAGLVVTEDHQSGFRRRATKPKAPNPASSSA